MALAAQAGHFECRYALQFEILRHLGYFRVRVYAFHRSDGSVRRTLRSGKPQEFGDIGKSSRDH
jgi:hypothetical protein